MLGITHPDDDNDDDVDDLDDDNDQGDEEDHLPEGDDQAVVDDLCYCSFHNG